MKPETQNLIHDLLDEQSDARREATLLASQRIFTRRHRRRATFRSLLTVTLLALVVFSLRRNPAPRPEHLAPSPPPSPVERLTDAELLALFPDMPVGLITFKDGRKELIFPRPGDEERFINRL